MAKRRNTAKRNSRPRSPDAGRIADRRKDFERSTREAGQDQATTRAFIEGKMAMVRGDLNLTEAEKQEALDELRRKLEKLSR